MDMGQAENTTHLTDAGWHRLWVEAHTLESLLEHAKRRVISSGHGRW